MNQNGIDLDAVFNGASVVLGATRDAIGAVNEARNLLAPESRRNYGPNPNAPMGGNPNSNYGPPVSYAYGYSDNTYYPTPNVGGRGYSQQNPFFGNGVGNYGGYVGFTNPGYGNDGGSYYNGNVSRVNGPTGGAWG